MKGRWIGTFLAAGIALAQEPATFRAGVSLVRVDAEVTSAEGRLLTGFTKDDFRVLDEGKERPVLHFSSGEEPLDLILLFDVSYSMKSVVEAVSAAAREGFRELRAGDRVAVMTFNTSSSLVAPFTEDLGAVERTIREDVVGGRFGGGTHIQAAVDDAARLFLAEKRSERRRAVLIVTDNIGTRTRREATVVRDFWEADAILSGLVVHNPKWEAMQKASIVLNPSNLALQAGMKGIAQKTGGDFIHSGDPGMAFPDAMHRIRTRYSLYYGLPPEGKANSTRTVHVELSAKAARQHPKARVRARTGYLVPERVE